MKRRQVQGNRGMIPVLIFSDPEELGAAIAQQVLNGIRDAGQEGRRFLLGCPGGRSLQSTYDALGKLAAEQEADLSHVVIVMMDDYLVQVDGRLTYCPPDAHFSCRRFAREDIQGVLNRGLAASRRIPDTQVWLPDPADPTAYDRRISEAGGIDLFLTASGASDGHVAFNPPGTSLDSGSRIVPIADTTRRDNLATFPEFSGLTEVPGHGVTVGAGTIVGQSRRVVLVMHGADKQHAAGQLFRYHGYTPSWPATLIFEAREAVICLDEAATQGLEVS